MLPGCRTADSSTLYGSVVDDTIAISAPTVPVPVPDVTAGLGRRPSVGARPRWGSSVATATAMGRVVRVATVDVEVGDVVEPGQVVARLDSAALDAGVDSARASQVVAEAQVRVLDQRLDDLAEARADLADARTEIASTIDTLQGNRAELASRLRSARDTLAELEATREQLGQAPSLPPGAPPSGGATLPPGVTPPGGTPGAGVPGSPPDPAELDAAIAELRDGIARLERGIARLDEGLDRARNGLSDIESARADTTDARSQIENARDLARIAAGAGGIAVDLATAQRDLAVLTSPVKGTVVSTLHAGEVVSPAAPVVEIRPEGASQVEAWLPPDQGADVELGDAAQVRIDSMPERALNARVSFIGTRRQYPPTKTATREVHLGRAIPVRFTLEDSKVWLPPGTPADVELDRRRADSTD